MDSHIIQTPLGPLSIGWNKEEYLTSVNFQEEESTYSFSLSSSTLQSTQSLQSPYSPQSPQSSILNKPSWLPHLEKYLLSYFNGEPSKLNEMILISFTGTEFQRRVYLALQTIPLGEIRSYQQIAQLIGSPNSYRAVATACKNNTILLVVPCHRVVGGKNYYSFNAGPEKKKWLLEHEKRIKEKGVLTVPTNPN